MSSEVVTVMFTWLLESYTWAMFNPICASMTSPPSCTTEKKSCITKANITPTHSSSKRRTTSSTTVAGAVTAASSVVQTKTESTSANPAFTRLVRLFLPKSGFVNTNPLTRMVISSKRYRAFQSMPQAPHISVNRYRVKS